jgi:hypothetical protein
VTFFNEISRLSTRFIAANEKTFVKLPRALDNPPPGEYTLRKFKLKPVTQTSKQNEVLPESCRRWKGSRNSFAEWTAEGGPNALPVGLDGLSPRYQGKTRDGASPSGRIFRQNGWHRRSFQTFVP